MNLADGTPIVEGTQTAYILACKYLASGPKFLELDPSWVKWVIEEFSRAKKPKESKMSEKRYIVPEEMLEAAIEGFYAGQPTGGTSNHPRIKTALEYALRHLAKHPILPRPDQPLPDFSYATHRGNWPIGKELELQQAAYREAMCKCLAEWQRQMFLTPEPKTPPEIEDLLWVSHLENNEIEKEHNHDVVEAYRRGQQSHHHTERGKS